MDLVTFENSSVLPSIADTVEGEREQETRDGTKASARFE